MSNAPVMSGALVQDAPDWDRRFGGLRRLHGPEGYERLRAARIAVVGVGGVGSWAVEALARSGVARLRLIDLDQVAESNINRQIQALDHTVGQAKVEALRDRIAGIHPGCEVQLVEDFLDEANLDQCLQPEALDGVIDCCDQLRAKAAIAAWGWAHGVPVVTVGAAGGKQQPQLVEAADLAEVTHDPLLASLRQRLRQRHGGARRGAMGVRCVFSREAVRPSQEPACDTGTTPIPGMALACHGYGSSVMVTATFGMVAAAQLTNLLISQ
jgi:tRNA A37 threonylcarbamoyladenosine dehydratase